jgi:glycosyltransferase involved in cell wall biosynthesis
VDRSQRNAPYTFGVMGDRGMRKGWDIAMKAFYNAFGETPSDDNYCPDVRLIYKVVEQKQSMLHEAQYFADRRVRLWKENAVSMFDYYAAIDCFLFPSRAEGFGLPCREAAATGLPVIATNYSGMADDVLNWGIPLDYEEIEVPAWAKETIWTGYDGKWAKPDIDALTSHMLWCYQNRNDAADIGIRGRKYLIENQTWEHSAKKMKALLDKYK